MTRQANGRFLKGEHWREHQPFREKDWLVREYVDGRRSTGDIAKQFGVRDTAIQFWMKKHGIKGRSISEARSVKKWGSFGEKNPMYGKRGPEVPAWRGGHTPERQAFHGSKEWAEVSSLVWRRDRGTCRKCSQKANDSEYRFDVHHVEPFANVALRAVESNLVLLCRKCHRWVHSKKNVGKLFLPASPPSLILE